MNIYKSLIITRMIWDYSYVDIYFSKGNQFESERIRFAPHKSKGEINKEIDKAIGEIARKRGLEWDNEWDLD